MDRANRRLRHTRSQSRWVGAGCSISDGSVLDVLQAWRFHVVPPIGGEEHSERWRGVVMGYTEERVDPVFAIRALSKGVIEWPIDPGMIL